METPNVWHAPAAIMKSKKGPASGSLYTDEDWNDEATLTDSAYSYSKVTALRAQHTAWGSCQ